MSGLFKRSDHVPSPYYRRFMAGLALGVLSCIGLLAPSVATKAQDQVVSEESQLLVIELFYRSDSEQSRKALDYLLRLEQRRAGIRIKLHDVLTDVQQRARLAELSKRFGMEKSQVPAFYLCDKLKIGFGDDTSSGPQIEGLLNIKAYVRTGCQHCIAGKAFLDDLVSRWPALKVEYFDVVTSRQALRDVEHLAASYKVQVPSFPCIQIAGRLVVGFQSAEITGRKMEALFVDRSVDYPPVDSPTLSPSEKSGGTNDGGAGDRMALRDWSGQISVVGSSQLDFGVPLTAAGVVTWVVQDPVDLPVEATPLPDEVPLPDDLPEVFDGNSMPNESLAADGELLMEGGGDRIHVPWFGELSVSEMGLPAFTFLVGLVDGFNPCAMWVLVFLLSVLVSIKDRRKILLVAGTFIVVSGLAYFVFMAAWFSVFQVVGLMRPVQVGLGVVAIVIGLINVKDFFAFHQGVSLSIPESSKPGIYRRVRKIVNANQMTTAISGAIVLAIVVNIVELLCTAGLPAMYTAVLAIQDISLWTKYAYLGLYICAYMLDDTILVAIVVTTLSNRRLQETEGRWLKLLSGVVILTLGVVMIFWPDSLI